MRTFPTALVVPGEVVTERELMDELRDIAEHANQLDDENFAPVTVTAAKLVLGTMNRLFYAATETHKNTNPVYDSVPVAVVETGLATGSEPIDAIPDATGAPWVATVTTRGEILYLTLQATASTSSGGVAQINGYVWIGLRVDGEIVARSADQSAQCNSDTWNVHAHLPVGPGAHVIEAIYGVSNSAVAARSTGDPAPGTITVAWFDRQMIAMERGQ